MKLYGTNLCETALTSSFARSEQLAEFISSLGMNAVRFMWGYRSVIQKKPAEFLYLIYALKQRGIKIAMPVRITPPTSFTDASVIADEKAWIDYLFGMSNPHTQTLVGQEVVLCEIMNETGVFKQMKPANWLTMTISERQASVNSLAQIEADWFGIVKAQLRLYTNALLIGSQSNYQFQSNTLDACDNHWYTNTPAGPSNGPWTFDNRILLDDGGCYPISLAHNRVTGKPCGVTEFNDSGPGWYYHTNMLLMIYTAAIQGYDWLFHFHMGMHPNDVPGRILGTNWDSQHLGKLEILKLGAKIFNETTPATALCGYNDSDYLSRVASTGFISPMNHHSSDAGFSYWKPLDGHAAKGQPLKISIPSIKTEIDSYLTCKITKTMGRCENSDMVWQDAQHYSSWGNGQVRFL